MPEHDQLADGATVTLVDDGVSPPRLEFSGTVFVDRKVKDGDTVKATLRLPAVPGPIVPDDRGRIVRHATVQSFSVVRRVARALRNAGWVRPRIRERSPRRSIRRASCRARSPGRKPKGPDPHHVSAGGAR
jgi:hypothetical protein